MRVQLPSYEGLSLVVERARRLFDLDADPLHITEHLRASPQMQRLVEQSPGLRLPGAWDGFELAVRAVLGEQLTAVRVTRLAGRLVKVFGRQVNLGEHGLTHLFPSPEVLAEADLTRFGVPVLRAAAIRSIATAAAMGALSLQARSDPADAISRLCAIPGIDQVTADYIAMRGLGEPDAFPAYEIGLRRALANGGSPFAASALECLAEGWRPWRAYAAMYLWAAQS